MSIRTQRKADVMSASHQRRAEAVATKWLARHGVVDANGAEDSVDLFKRTAFEGAMICSGLIGIALATGHHGARIILPA